MAFQDVRQFIEALDKAGELVRVKQEVDWDLEVGAISRRACERQGPAVLFEKIKDYPEGNRILSGSIATYGRLAIAMGLDPDTPVNALFDEYERREQHPVKPVVVDGGSCQENILKGDEVDLYRFPAPMIHEGDGGRYLATWHLVASKDQESGWTNWGMYRFMLHNSKFLVGFPQPQSHLAMLLRDKYIPSGKPMPVAIAIGAEPLTLLAAASNVRMGEDEADYAGALRQEPVELVKCETNDLLVPAHSEIVIEGEIEPDKCVPEGPFGEFTGYRNPGGSLRPLCRVTAITYRTSPILTMCSVGIPVDENHSAWVVAQSLGIKKSLKRHGVPVVGVSMVPEAGALMAVISVESGGRKVAEQIGELLTARRGGLSKILVVDSDVDIHNLGEVAHAFTMKCHPKRGIIVIDCDGKANPVMPFYTAEEKRGLKGGTVVFDCTWPVEWSKESVVPMKSSFASIYPKELQDKVLRNWNKYGFK